MKRTKINVDQTITEKIKRIKRIKVEQTLCIISGDRITRKNNPEFFNHIQHPHIIVNTEMINHWDDEAAIRLYIRRLENDEEYEQRVKKEEQRLRVESRNEQKELQRLKEKYETS